MEADATPVWKDMIQILISGVCWEICRQLVKVQDWLWPIILSTALVCKPSSHLDVLVLKMLIKHIPASTDFLLYVMYQV